MNDVAIKVEQLNKVYPLYDHPTDRLKEALHPFKKIYHRAFFALKDISFQINKGETIGIIGTNGAGKSTLLKVITGVLTQTSGTVEVNGKVASLLELGTGFNPEMTGIENIYLNGSIMGFSRKEMDERVDSIIEFADIGDFIHQPVKVYSSGMFARLAFSVAINVEPDILIVDEALSVGDVRFVQKCIRKMKEFIDNNKTVIFVTHDMGAVNSFCSRTIWINGGVMKEIGDTLEITKRYLSFMAYGLETEKKEKKEIKKNIIERDTAIKWKNTNDCESFGGGYAKITHIAFYNEDTNTNITYLKGGEKVSLFVKINIMNEISSPGVGLQMTDRLGSNIFSISSYVDENNLGVFHAKEEIIIKIEFDFPQVLNGEYHLTVAISDGTQQTHIQHHWVNDVVFFNVLNPDISRYTMGMIPIAKSKCNILNKSQSSISF